MRNVKITFDTITNLLGEQLIPSHPFFILTLLQSLENQISSYDVAPTSYAYCYHSLIHVSLLRQSVPNDKIGSVFNFLTELSFWMYEGEKSTISKVKLQEFYANYTDKYVFYYGFQDILSILTEAVILSDDENNYNFSYKYLAYYLTAKKISTILTSVKGKTIVNSLIYNLNNEMNANILVFLTHHTKDNNLLEEILFKSMLPFEDFKPITLETDDSFFKFLSNFVSTIEENILPESTNPAKNREKDLIQKDKLQIKRQSSKSEDDSEEISSSDLVENFKVIKILGQIIKNQHGNFEKEKLISMLEAAYNACFRSIDHLSTVLESDREEVIEAFLEKHSKDKKEITIRDKEILKSKISGFLYYIGYRLCLGSFANLSLAVGTQNIDDIYDQVAKRINSPAAKLITFNIKTYYGKLSIPELIRMKEDFKGNPVALHMLTSRVYSYLYNNYVNYEKRSKIANILELKSLPIAKKGK